MNRSKKVILGLIIIIGLSLLIPLIIYNDQVGILAFPEQKLTYSLFIGPVLNGYLFWASVVLFVLLVASFFVVLFWPKKEKSVIVRDLNGQLKIEQKSIESYVAANLDQRQFIEKPKIKVNMTKNKIAVKVLGRFGEYQGIVPSAEQAMVQMKEELQTLLGVTDRSIDIVIEFVDYVPEESKKSRVE
ncbi:alkaline shock response membrane anchor protein AmaP [Enterococcus sp. LJL51]|uniref:alkaline shock response membrane anchor protein AmaP n=1 Tax=Enterococcus sp. LJL51 TaxID=3416656 RepID=UPI003CF91A00